MDTTPNPIPFSPAPHLIDAIVADLGNAAASLDDIAARHHTTVEALARWMTSPEIAPRLAATDDAVTWRTRLLASRTLPLVVITLNKVLQDYQAARLSPADFAHNPLRAAVLTQRARETARIAATTLLRLRRISSVGLPGTPTLRVGRMTPDHTIQDSSTATPAAPSPHPTSDIPNPTSPADAAYISATADLEALIALLAKINPPESPEPPSAESNPSGATASSLPVPATGDAAPAPISDSLDPSAPSDSFVPFPHPTSDIAHPTFPLELTPAGASHEQDASLLHASWP